MASIEHQVRAFIVENYMYGESPESLGNDDSFLARGIIDSAGILELVAFLEESYGIRIHDEELLPENLDSVARVAGYVGRKAGGANLVEVANAG